MVAAPSSAGLPMHSPITVFLVLTVLLSLPFYLLLNLSGAVGQGMRLFVAGLMWAPGLAALWVTRHEAGRWRGLGVVACAPRFLWAGYGIPLAYGLLVYGLVWTLGLGEFSPAQYLAMNGRGIGLAGWPDAARVGLMIVLQLGVGLVLALATAFGEELGWRGFLAPRLIGRFGFGVGSVVTGLVWALWHVPTLFLANYHAEVPRAFAMGCFFVSLIGMSFVYHWLRLRSGSVWPAVLMHASHNAAITLVFSALTADTGRTAWWIDEFGAMLAAVSVLMALAVSRRPNPVGA